MKENNFRKIAFRAWDWKNMSDTFDLWDLSYEWFPDLCLDDTWENIMPHIIFMQYVWIKDKNWKEIYEWDIVKWYVGIAEVVYSIDLGLAPWFTLSYKDLNNEINIYDCEVVGNIYENPDLINY